jgi:hypothetical protein
VLLHPPGLAVHREKTDCSYLKERFSAQYIEGYIWLKIIDGVYRSRYNFELDNREFNSPNVISVVKNNRLRYAGHMIRGAEDLELCIGMRWKADETKEYGNPG